jgi:tRNA-guanine family transglycosylase
MVYIYPVVEVKDFVYGQKYGWLDALLQSAQGFMLRPERELGKAFSERLTLRQHLQRRYGVQLDGGVIMMDHGIMSQSFSEVFGLAKTPKNIIRIYKALEVDYGIAYDVPVRLCLQTKCGDPEVRSVKTAEELSRLAVEVGARRLREMAEEAKRVGFQGLVPVVQGLSRGDVEHSAEEAVRIMAEVQDSFTAAIGTGGRSLSQEDVSLIRYAVYAVEKYAVKYSVKVRIHLPGWSSPDRIRDVDLLRKIYSADSLTPRRRAVEGKAYVIVNGRLKLVNAKELVSYNCGCSACAAHKEYVVDPSGKRRNDVRMVHNVYVLQKYLAGVAARTSLYGWTRHVAEV